MIATLSFGGVPVVTTVEVQEPAATGTVQAQIKALTEFTNHGSGKATTQDIRAKLAGITLNGKTDR